MRPAVESPVSEHVVCVCVSRGEIETVNVCVLMWARWVTQCAVLLDPQSSCHLEPTGLGEERAGGRVLGIKRRQWGRVFGEKKKKAAPLSQLNNWSRLSAWLLTSSLSLFHSLPFSPTAPFHFSLSRYPFVSLTFPKWHFNEQRVCIQWPGYHKRCLTRASYYKTYVKRQRKSKRKASGEISYRFSQLNPTGNRADRRYEARCLHRSMLDANSCPFSGSLTC